MQSSPPPEPTTPAPVVRLDPEQFQQLQQTAIDANHNVVLALCFCIALLSALALMYAISR